MGFRNLATEHGFLGEEEMAKEAEKRKREVAVGYLGSEEEFTKKLVKGKKK